MATRTIYEVSKPDVKFYAVEKSGFTTVGEVIDSAVNDMLQLGAFSVSNLVITTSSAAGNVTMPTAWPPAERIIRVVNGGAGYKVGDQLKVGNAAVAVGTTANIRVSSIGANGTVTGVTITNVGPYIGNPVAASKPTAFINSNYNTGFLTCLGNVTLAGGTQPTLIPANVALIPSVGVTQPAPTPATPLPDVQWNTDNGAGGIFTKYPRTGFWANILYADAISGNANVFIGQTIYLSNAGGTSSPDSTIPDGTTITAMHPLEVVTGTRELTQLKRPTSGVSPNQTIYYGPWIETTQQYTWFEVSTPIVAKIGDNIALRGAGLTISDTTTQLPAGFKVILEAGASVDPLNDQVGVFGAVSASTSNSNIVIIKNLTTPNNFNPVIYAGQTVTSVLQNGAIDGFVTVVSVTPTGSTTANVVLSSNQTLPVDEPLHFKFAEQQPWRVAFDVVRNATNPSAGPQQLLAYAATPVQLQDNGNIANIWNVGGTAVIDRAGMMGAFPSTTALQGAPDPTKPDEGFLNRTARVATNPEVYPLNYSLALTNRGMFFGVWEGTWSTIQKTKARSTLDNDNYFNWFLIQRPVNRYTGKVLTVGRTPVFCVNSVGYKYWKFVVREEDVLHPSLGDPQNSYNKYVTQANGVSTISTVSTPYRVPADAHTQDSFGILNTTNQIALTEDSKYLVSFLHNLTTPRFRYSEELDMIGQTSADVCMAGNDVSITAYGESGPRIYRALPANNPYNSGLRICVLRNIPI
jgi:hypothetical protein